MKTALLSAILLATMFVMPVMAQEPPHPDEAPPELSPPQPEGFMADEIGARFIKFSIEPPLGTPTIQVDEYVISCQGQSDLGGQAYGVVGRIKGKQKSFLYTGLEPETTYVCQASSYNADRHGESRGTPLNGLSVTTTAEGKGKVLEVNEETAKEIVVTAGKIPTLKTEEIKSVKQNVVVGTKAGKLIGIFPVSVDVSVEIDKQTLKQKVSKPFWAFLVTGL